MLANRFNPLRSKQDDAPPAGGGKAAAQESDAGGEAGEKNGDEGGEEDEDPENPAAPEKTETPSASTGKLSAFERGKLRLLGSGDLVARIDLAETEVARLQGENTKLTAENVKLAAKVAAFEKETPEKIAAAAKGRENEVSKKVTAELSALGVTEAEAPSQIGAEQTPEAMLEHFATLKGAERTAYWRANSKVLKAADSNGTAKNK